MKNPSNKILIPLFLAGLLLAAWPLGQIAYGKWHQFALRASMPAVSSPSPKSRQTATRTSSGKGLQKTPTFKAAAMSSWEPLQLIVPQTDLDAIVVSGVDQQSLRRGPGFDPSSSLPGQKGNCVIAGHRNAYGWWFYRLHELSAGSEIYLRSSTAEYLYHVMSTAVVDESHTSILKPSREDGPPQLTLYTCTLPKSRERVVVFAELVSSANLY